MKRIKVVMLSCVLLVFMVMGNLTGVLASGPVTFKAPIDLVSPSGTKTTVECTFMVIAEASTTSTGKVQVGDGTDSAIVKRTSGDITIPDTVINDGKKYVVTAIGQDAFISCTALTNTGLASNTSVETIGDDAFYECEELISTGLESNDKIKTIGAGAFIGCSKLISTGLASNQTVKNIGEAAFAACTGLTSTGLESNTTVETIGDQAFVMCTELKGVLIPENSSIISIGGQAFGGCDKFNLVIINGNKIPTIGNEAFPSNAIIYYPEGATNSENLVGYDIKPFKIHNVKVDESSLAKNYTVGDTFTLAGLKFIIQLETGGNLIDKPERSKRYEDIADKFKFDDIILKEGVNTIKYSCLDKEYSFEITALASAPAPTPTPTTETEQTIPDNSVPETGIVNDKTILINLLGISGLGLVALGIRRKRLVK